MCPDFRATDAPRLSKEPGASHAQLGAPVRQMIGMAPCQSVHIQRCLRWDEPHARERPKASRERAKRAARDLIDYRLRTVLILLKGRIA